MYLLNRCQKSIQRKKYPSHSQGLGWPVALSLARDTVDSTFQQQHRGERGALLQAEFNLEQWSEWPLQRQSRTCTQGWSVLNQASRSLAAGLQLHHSTSELQHPHL